MSELQQKSILDFITQKKEKNKKRKHEEDDEDSDDGLVETLLPILTDLASIKPTVEDTNKVVKNLNKEQAALTKTVNNNTKSIANLSTRMNIIDQRYYEAMMEICGISPATLEATKNTLAPYTLEIIKRTSPSITSSHLDSPYIRKFKVGQGQGEKAVIVVRFYSKSARVMVMSDRRNAKLNDGIFFNEVLTRESRSLLFEARKLKKEGKLQHVWTRDGTICVRKTEGAPMKKILSTSDLLSAAGNQTSAPQTAM